VKLVGALNSLHQAGLSHNDIHQGNILITHTGLIFHDFSDPNPRALLYYARNPQSIAIPPEYVFMTAQPDLNKDEILNLSVFGLTKMLDKRHAFGKFPFLFNTYYPQKHDGENAIIAPWSYAVALEAFRAAREVLTPASISDLRTTVIAVEESPLLPKLMIANDVYCFGVVLLEYFLYFSYDEWMEVVDHNENVLVMFIAAIEHALHPNWRMRSLRKVHGSLSLARKMLNDARAAGRINKTPLAEEHGRVSVETVSGPRASLSPKHIP
jgi:serine/threonine protein kinase